MIMSQTNIDEFPNFARYVRRQMPTVVSVPVIVRNMRRFGSLSRSELVNALTWGSGPHLRIVNLRSTAGLPGFQVCVAGVAAANGCFRHAAPDAIEIDRTTISNFENDSGGAGTDLNTRGGRVFIAGTTILHELCHWGNFNHSVAETAEAGVAFEVATYGRNTG